MQENDLVSEARLLAEKLKLNHENRRASWSIQGEAAEVIEELLRTLQCKDLQEQ